MADDSRQELIADDLTFRVRPTGFLERWPYRVLGDGTFPAQLDVTDRAAATAAVMQLSSAAPAIEIPCRLQGGPVVHVILQRRPSGAVDGILLDPCVRPVLVVASLRQLLTPKEAQVAGRRRWSAAQRHRRGHWRVPTHRA
jgi:hypothetical protein